MEDVVRESIEAGLLPREVKIYGVRHFTRVFKQATRTRRFQDRDGRSVREFVPNRIERLDANGNRVFDVILDHLHEMSLDHALSHFSQREENIEKQKHAATKDLQSALDNNPNMAGQESQFCFSFMVEEPVPVTTEKIAETINVESTIVQQKPR